MQNDGQPTTFHSILFDASKDRTNAEVLAEPAHFRDLNLDQIVDAITSGREEYNLKPFFYHPLKDVPSITYRHEVMRDLENEVVYAHINSFSCHMRAMRTSLELAARLRNHYQRARWFVDAVETYCDAVGRLLNDLASADIYSAGFASLREYLATYVKSANFIKLLAEVNKIKTDLSSIRYDLLIRDTGITVRKYASDTDYSADVVETFAKFKQGAAKSYVVTFRPVRGVVMPDRREIGETEDYIVTFRDVPDMNHLEAKALEFVVRLYPDIFLSMGAFYEAHVDFADDTIRVFDREVQFYIAYLDYTLTQKQAGLRFCYPTVSTDSKEECSCESFDLALAQKLTAASAPVVCNDFHLSGDERIIIVSGPNQGGKTTFARAFGQLHYMASLGCTVPGSRARLFVCDKILTHFEREETIEGLHGKLETDLMRLHAMLEEATSNSIIILNETFTSTTSEDASMLATNIMSKIIALDLMCVFVTFLDELASLGKTTVSMVSSVAADNPALRTYEILRKPADGLAYALAIAEKYRLTYECVKDRIRS